MKNLLILSICICGLLSGCKKAGEEFSVAATPQFKTYLIKTGEHYADQNVFSELETSILKFVVKFDSSAIYTTSLSENQYDINKLYGFSDNEANHHQYSARIGWGWSENELRLYAYVYNAGSVISKEITTVAPGTEIQCSIVVSATNYIFKVNNSTEVLPRAATTVKAKGYRLYPYFGGDEPAPHDISIMIREENL
jgi:hypothetical protein